MSAALVITLTHPALLSALRRSTVLFQHGGPAWDAFGHVARLADAPQIRPHARRVGDHRDELHAAASRRALEYVDGKGSGEQFGLEAARASALGVGGVRPDAE